MVGRDYEAGGIAKDGAKLVTAVACAARAEDHASSSAAPTAPAITACAAAPTRPRFLFTWPNARISVMGGEQAASVLATVRRDNIEAEGRTWTRRGGGDASRRRSATRYEAEGNPYYATARLWDDGIILPCETRRVLALALSAALNAPVEETRFGVFRM